MPDGAISRLAESGGPVGADTPNELARTAKEMPRESTGPDEEYTRVRSIILSTLGIAMTSSAG